MDLMVWIFGLITGLCLFLAVAPATHQIIFDAQYPPGVGFLAIGVYTVGVMCCVVFCALIHKWHPVAAIIVGVAYAVAPFVLVGSIIAIRIGIAAIKGRKS